MTNIYILKLENNKYYVGKTNNIELRLNNHFNYNGSFWTKKYKPQEIVEIIKNCDEFDEDKYTIKMMKKYGIENVRGGSFCKFKLSNDNINTIKQMILFNSDICYICEKDDHFGNKCPFRKRKIEVEKEFVNKKRKIDEIYNPNQIQDIIKKENCQRCYRINHSIENCYAKKYKNGVYIKEKKYQDIKNINYIHPSEIQPSEIQSSEIQSSEIQSSEINKRKKIKLSFSDFEKEDLI
jgi:predicted GIY-YIG superfamily endonuclease